MRARSSAVRAFFTLTFARDALRAAGAAVAAFILVNLAGEALRPPFATLHDWISIPASPWLSRALALLLAIVLVANAVLADRPPLLRRAGALLTAGVAVIALADVVSFYRALHRGAIWTPAILPASLLV